MLTNLLRIPEDQISHKLRYKAVPLEQMYKLITKQTSIDNPEEKYFQEDFSGVENIEEVNNILSKAKLKTQESGQYCTVNSLHIVRKGGLDENALIPDGLSELFYDVSNIDNLLVACDDGSIRLLSLETGRCINVIVNPKDPGIPIAHIETFNFYHKKLQKALRLLISVTVFGSVRIHVLSNVHNYRIVSNLSLEALYPPFVIYRTESKSDGTFLVAGGSEISRLSVKKLLADMAESSFSEHYIADEKSKARIRRRSFIQA